MRESNIVAAKAVAARREKPSVSCGTAAAEWQGKKRSAKPKGSAGGKAATKRACSAVQKMAEPEAEVEWCDVAATGGATGEAGSSSSDEEPLSLAELLAKRK